MLSQSTKEMSGPIWDDNQINSDDDNIDRGPNTPSYAQPTISFSRHHNTQAPKRKIIASKGRPNKLMAKDRTEKIKSCGSSAYSHRDYGKVAVDSVSQNLRSSTLSRMNAKSFREAGRGKASNLFSLFNADGAVKSYFKKYNANHKNYEQSKNKSIIYPSVYSNNNNEKENGSGFETQGAGLGKTGTGRHYDPFSTPDDNKENLNPGRKSSYVEPVLKNSFQMLNENDVKLKVRYERLEIDSGRLSADIDSYFSKYQESKSSGTNDSVFPKHYLKSLVGDRDYVSAQDWYYLVDLISSIIDDTCDNQSAEYQYMLVLNNQLKQELTSNYSAYQKTIEELSTLKSDLSNLKEKDANGSQEDKEEKIESCTRQLNQIIKKLKEGIKSAEKIQKQILLSSPDNFVGDFVEKTKLELNEAVGVEKAQDDDAKTEAGDNNKLMQTKGIIGIKSPTDFLNSQSKNILKIISPIPMSKNNFIADELDDEDSELFRNVKELSFISDGIDS